MFRLLEILTKDVKHTSQLLEQAGFNLDKPFKSFQSENIDAMIHQQMDNNE